MEAQDLLKALRKIQTEHNPHVSPSDKIIDMGNGDKIYILKTPNGTYAIKNPVLIGDELYYKGRVKL